MALALLVASEMGINDKDLFERLPQYRPSTLRGKTLQGRGNKYFVDCYNANPSSMIDSINFFSSSNAEIDKLFMYWVEWKSWVKMKRNCMYKVGRGLILDSNDLVILIR